MADVAPRPGGLAGWCPAVCRRSPPIRRGRTRVDRNPMTRPSLRSESGAAASPRISDHRLRLDAREHKNRIRTATKQAHQGPSRPGHPASPDAREHKLYCQTLGGGPVRLGEDRFPEPRTAITALCTSRTPGGSVKCRRAPAGSMRPLPSLNRADTGGCPGRPASSSRPRDGRVGAY